MFAMFGTFVDYDEGTRFKVFNKCQLVDYSPIKKTAFEENDSFDLKILLFDSGFDNVSAKILGI